MEPHADPEMDPSFGLIPAQNSPNLLTGDLGTFLGVITPSGAAALHLALWGVRLGLEHFPLPLTMPKDPRPDWLRGELRAITVKGVPLKDRDIEQLVGMLAAGPARTDGLPAYAPHIWGSSGALSAKGRRGGWVRRIAAAVAADLGNYDLAEVSAKVLNLSDHRDPNGGPPRDPRKAREYRNLGRGLLSVVGVWPWAHAPGGMLPLTWRSEAVYLDPLRLWLQRALGEREQELARCRVAWAEGHRVLDKDLLKLPAEGAHRRVDPAAPVHIFGRDVEAEQASWRALDAYMNDQAEREAAFERARAARRRVH